MCRRSSVLAILIALVAGVCGASAQQPLADPVEAYLLEAGLPQLLALHWENKLHGARGDEREQLLARLAQVYGDLLARAESEEERLRWERKARRLLPEMPEVEATGLQLSLIRARYLPAEQIAERQRLRMAEGGEVDEAQRGLAVVSKELDELDRLLIERLRYLESASKRDGPRGERAAEVYASLAELQSWVQFYQGWSRYYDDMLGGEDDSAYEALLAFAGLLGQEDGRLPSLRAFPADRMRFEMQARAAIGVALCLSLRGETNEAIRWLDEIAAAEDVAPNIAAQIPLRKLIVLGEGGQWIAFSRVRTDLEQERELTPLDARLIAILALEGYDASGNELALTEASYALARLGDTGQLGHVVDLVRLYGSEALGTSGFIGQFVKGLDSFQRARDLHERSGNLHEPSTDPSVVDRYRPAIQYLRNAVASGDADRFPEAQRSAARHLGLSLYFSSRFLEAADVFRAAAATNSVEAQESLHLAILALEAAVRDERRSDSPIGGAVAALRQAIDAYLRRFPDGSHVREVQIKRATLGGLPPDEALRILLDIPPGDPNYEQARRHAARMLWNRYSEAEPFDRPALAQRYLRVATPLLELDRQRGQAGDREAQGLFVGRARRVLSAAMTFGLEDRAVATPWLAALEAAQAQGWAGTEALRSELVYRRAQLLTATGRIGEAAAHVAAARDAEIDRYVQAATRRIFDSALIAWRDDPADAELLDVILRFGEMLVADAGGDAAAATALGRPVLEALAEAHAQAARASDSPVAAGRARALYAALIDAGLGTAEIHANVARLAEGLGDLPGALAGWRSALAYLEAGSQDWFEARYNTLRLLAEIDPSVAAAALAQHHTLYPGYGPPPWGERIRALAEHLPAPREDGEAGE